jgi:predicted Co/Zn/Cd cation transporter (cation efflux family)
VRFGVPVPQALAFAVFTHLVGYAQTTVLGLLFLYFVGLSLGELHSAVQTMDHRPEGSA